jgi:short-chain fatty acids transporter
LKKLTNFFVAIVNRWLPDAFLFAVILTIVTYILALIFTDNGPIAMVNYWGNSKGFWGLLAFSMQMAMVVVLGTAFANAPVCKRILKTIATLAHDNKSAILTVTFISTICCWLNWGFGLVAGALLAKEIARRVPTVDYRLLIASAYSGLRHLACRPFRLHSSDDNLGDHHCGHNLHRSAFFDYFPSRQPS